MADPRGRRFEVPVRVRWSDLDAYNHVNNARVLTLLEEARVDWLFVEGARQGATRLTDGLVVASFEIRYQRPVGFGQDVRVSMGVVELRASSFLVDYRLTVDGAEAVLASSRLVPVDMPAMRPRRWDEAERRFLAQYLQEG